MADFTNLTGFFTVIGSRDLPRNYSLTDNFGFDADNPNTPVFNYSMKDVISAFQKPRDLTRVSVYNIYPTEGDVGPQEISSLTAESYENDGLAEQVDLNASDWTDVFKVLEYLFRNQSTVGLPPNSDVNAVNRADEELNPDNTSSPWSVETYWYNSIVIENSDLTGRIKVATFTMNMSQNTVTFTVYFTANAIVEDYSPSRMQVYRYTDTDGDPTTISQDEFNTEIIQKTMDILKEGRYKRVDIKIVEFHDNDGVTITPEAFYVYSSFAPEYDLPATLITAAVKNYLKEVYNNDLGALAKNYPDLFATDTVMIFPLTTNRSGTTTFHPVELSVLRSELLIRGFGYDPNNGTPGEPEYKSVELFYLGSEDSGSTEPVYRYPMVAIENEPDSTSKPISGRTPNYLPVFSSYPDPSNPDNWTFGGETPIERVFHYLVFLAIGLSVDSNDDGINDIAVDDPRIAQIPNDPYEFTINTELGSVISVTFVINGVLYTILPER